MKQKQKDWTVRAASLDFDPKDQVKNRVWSRLQQPKLFRRRRVPVWAWAVCFALVISVGLLMVRPFAPAFFHQTPLELSEEDCAKLNGRYLLARALAQSKEHCPCEQNLTGYDKQTVMQLRHELESIACTVCSAKEQIQLQQCQKKYPSQLKEIKLCRTLC